MNEDGQDMGVMSIEFEDRTGQIPTADEFAESIQAIGNALVKDITKIPPYLGIQLATIHRCLKFGQVCRNAVEKQGLGRTEDWV